MLVTLPTLLVVIVVMYERVKHVYDDVLLMHIQLFKETTNFLDIMPEICVEARATHLDTINLQMITWSYNRQCTDGLIHNISLEYLVIRKYYETKIITQNCTTLSISPLLYWHTQRSSFYPNIVILYKKREFSHN